MGAPVIILGGILGGFFTPTEAAASARCTCSSWPVVPDAALRGTWPHLPRHGLHHGQIMLIIGASTLLSWILAREQVPRRSPRRLLGLTDNPVVFLLIVNVLLLLLGMILEPTSALLIVTPILLPVAVEFGIDPLQLGSIVIFNLMIGLLTPPMGGVALRPELRDRHPRRARLQRCGRSTCRRCSLVLLLITYVPAITPVASGGHGAVIAGMLSCQSLRRPAT